MRIARGQEGSKRGGKGRKRKVWTYTGATRRLSPNMYWTERGGKGKRQRDQHGQPDGLSTGDLEKERAGSEKEKHTCRSRWWHVRSSSNSSTIARWTGIPVSEALMAWIEGEREKKVRTGP
jgi:hypothetical protein